MRIRIYSSGIEAPLTPFIAGFLGNVCVGIASSLKTPQPIKTLKLKIDGDQVRISVNELPVILDHRFWKEALQGMIWKHSQML